ncbi:MAG: KpsF/GutQ family sugar-phosphate isomerase [Saprospiraceae bacterium]|nr:KpsF/GutQ family sugar-phosphate isomerase [Saprospiraceae bacterium]
MDQNNLIISSAKNCIDIEIQALQKLKETIDESFVQAVLSIYNCKGRLVVTGIGKSAIIGQKIVATLNSTGTPSLFMHAADAIHGDLGMIKPEDIIICISKSGETSEIKVLIPLIKSFGSKFIAIVSNLESSLAHSADFVLHTPIDQEADPNNLAPTASTIAQMAMGDALSVALLALRGFTPADFAKFHPGGALGKQLYLRVGDLSKRHTKPHVKENSSLKEIIISISTNRLGATAVLNQENEVVGIITDGDLRRMLQQENPIESITAQQIMSKNPKSIQANELAITALETMRKASITQLIALDVNRYEGIIHLHDLVKEGIV